MSAAKRVRWICPTGEHSGELGSSRPAKDALVRYCIPCSLKAGKLIERRAPLLERKRSAAQKSAAAKAKAKRARQAAAKRRATEAETALYTVEGVDLRDELTRLLRLKTWGGRFGTPGRDGGFHRRPTFTMTRRSTVPTRLGFAEPWANRIHLTRYPGITLADARETLVHELTHLKVDIDDNEWHGNRFRATMTAAFKEAYKVLPLGVAHNSYHGRYAAALRKKEAS
jgi:hypothetical protein